MRILNFSFVFLFILLVPSIGRAQQQLQFYGTCSTGGQFQNGSVYRYSPDVDTIQVLSNFENSLGEGVFSNSFIEHTSGLLLGTTFQGGKNNTGIIFTYNCLTNTSETLFDFDSLASGANPTGSLIKGENGFYYGTTTYGGLYNYGILYRFNPDNQIFQKLYEFNGTEGYWPSTQILLSKQHKIYGTALGGTGDKGIIYEYDVCSENFQIIYNFPYSGVNGDRPNGVIQANNGRLYGTTSRGGLANAGVFFEFDLTTNTFSLKGNFASINGEQPKGLPLQTENGLLIGTSLYGDIYQFNPVSGIFSLAAQFTQSNTNMLLSTFVTGPNGNLYCTGDDINLLGYGSIIEFDHVSQQYNKRYTFLGTEGTHPARRLYLASNNKMYGYTSQGGGNLSGDIFEFDPNSNTYTKKIDLNMPNKGKYPNGDLILAPNGLYYGTTFHGGVNNMGTIFSINPISNELTTLYNFTGSVNGSHPCSGMVLGNDGKLYGMTSNGGTSTNAGVIYRFDLNNQTITELINFNGTNGAFPEGKLYKANDGTFFGLTNYGGQYSNGTIFHFDPMTLAFQTINHLQFPPTNGQRPLGHITSGNNGKFYSVTSDGGVADMGAIIEIDTSLNTSTVIHSFDNSGYNPDKSLILVSDGNLYGIGQWGGSNNSGIIWKFELSSGTYTIVHNFDNINGKMPTGTLVEGSNQVIYGVTNEGGINNLGIIYSYDIPNDTLIKLFDFNSTSGANPIGSFSLEQVTIEFNFIDLSDTFCLNSNSRIYFESNGIFSSANQFIAELSDASGSFSSPTIIGTSVNSIERFIDIHIPSSLVPSNQYRMRIRSTGTVFTGNDNGFNLTIETDNQAPIPPIVPDTITTCNIGCLPAPNANDNCGQSIEGYTNFSFPITSVGTHQVTWIFEDGNGNQSSTIQNVTIVADSLPPSPIIMELDSLISYCALTSIYTPLAIDACGSIIEGVPSENIPITSVGVHEIIWTYTDQSGNISSQNQIVTIEPIPSLSIINSDPNLSVNLSSTTFDLQWIDCNSNQVVQVPSSSTFNAPYNGDFALQVIAPMGCQFQSDCIQIVNSLNTTELNNFGIQLYPNPNVGELKISHNDGLTFKSCVLIDMNGRHLIPDNTLNNGTNIQLTLKSIESGFYFIFIEFEEGVFQDKIIKVSN